MQYSRCCDGERSTMNIEARPSESADRFIAAMGMAKTEADGGLSWKIENTISGTMLVNGIDISKMGGGGG